MPSRELSARLAAVVDALPLRPGLRVLEIGCGPGAAARAVVKRIGDGYVLAIDRSANAILHAQQTSRQELPAGRLGLRQAAVEAFALDAGEAPYDFIRASSPYPHDRRACAAPACHAR